MSPLLPNYIWISLYSIIVLMLNAMRRGIRFRMMTIILTVDDGIEGGDE